MNKKEIEVFIRQHLSLNEGAYIFKKRQCIAKGQIKDLKQSVAPKMGLIRLFDVINSEGYQINESDKCTITLFVYVYNAAASYIDTKLKDCPEELKERRSSYLLLLEYDHYIVIFKKNIGSLTALKDCIDTISTRKLANALIKVGTQYKKLTTTNMGMSDNSTRNVSYEGNMLQSSIPIFGNNRKVVSNVSFVNGNESYGISLNTSRLAKLGSKKSLNELCIWVNNVLHEIDSYVEKPSFLNNFAFHIIWGEMFGTIKPSSILFNIHSLWDYISSETDGGIYYEIDKKKENYRCLNEKLVNKIWDLGNSYDLTFDQSKSNTKKEIYKVDDRFKKSVIVQCTKRKIHISTKGLWSKIYLKREDGQYVKIWDVINKNNFFQVGFEDCSLIYMHGSLYKDANIGDSIDTVLSILDPRASIITSQYEKFKDNKPKTTDIDFGCYSLFHLVESEYFSDSKYIVCDDLGDEWADHICIKDDTISFVHSKWKKNTSLSASNFQDVIGQALKNIGNLQQDGNRIDSKRQSLKEKYKPTQMYRMRKNAEGNIAKEVDDFINDFNRIVKSPNGIREVCIVVNFLSKKDFKEALDKIRNNQNFQEKRYAIQLFWILSSFVSSCKASDLHCRIICGE